METADLYRIMEKENIYYIHHELKFTRAMIENEIEEIELLADITAWKEFFPYNIVRKLVIQDRKTASEIADYFKVETTYIAKCLNYYYEKSNGFKSLDITN